MTTISSLWLMVLIEVLVVTTIVTIFLIAIRVIRNQKDRVAAQRLVQKIKEDSLRRKEETQKLLQRKFGFDEEQAREISSMAGREEKKFYQNTINFYLKRDAASFGNLNIDFEAALDPYRNLEPPGIGHEASSETPVNESEEIKRLEIENKRLSDEVAVTMNTMSRMLDEYSSMFAGGAEDDQAEIRKQMQESLGIEPDPEEEADTIDETEVSEDELAVEDQEQVDDEVMSEFEEDASGILDPEQEQTAEMSEDEEEMDDLSDLDPVEDDDLNTDGKLDNPDELLG